MDPEIHNHNASDIEAIRVSRSSKIVSNGTALKSTDDGHRWLWYSVPEQM